MINIIKYSGNKEVLVKLIEELQDYLVQIDPLKRLRRLPEYGEVYINKLLEKIDKHNGAIFLAEFENIPIGMIAGVVEVETKENELECVPSRPARVLELIVSEKYRGQNVGSLLMKAIEEYFKKQGCDIIRVEVFEPNKRAHNFYQKLGFRDRVIDLVKKLAG